MGLFRKVLCVGGGEDNFMSCIFTIYLFILYFLNIFTEHVIQCLRLTYLKRKLNL